MRFRFFFAFLLILSCATAEKRTSAPSSVGPVPMKAPQASTLLTKGPASLAAECDRALQAATQAIALTQTAQDAHSVLSFYDNACLELANAAARMSLAKSVHPDAAMRETAETCEQKIEALNVELSLDGKVYAALKQVDVSTEDAATQKWMEKTLLEFRRSGVDRDEATRTKVKKLNEELVKLGQEFNKNIRDDVRTVAFKPQDLKGLPEDYLKGHPATKEGKVLITSNYPDYFPFMMYAESAAARKELWTAYRQRGFPKNEAILETLLKKRHELATLLGYPHWAAYNTENKMVRSAEAATEFIDKVNQAAWEQAKADSAALLLRKKKHAPKATSVEPWEHDFLEDKLKNEKFGFDSQALRPYFEFERVLAGVLDLNHRLFGVEFQRVLDAQVWHPEVQTYDVWEGQQLLGRIHLDMHPREGKYKHAAMFDLTEGQAGKLLPEGVLVCNFPKSTPDAPGLMQHSEVETLFHEFGHLMHHIFGGHQKWATISGIRTEWDFVEVPSMLLQEWASDPATLQSFAKHYQTQEAIPANLLEKLQASREFGKGTHTRRQMFLSAVSLEFHKRTPPFNTTQVFKELQPQFEPFRREYVEGTHFHLAFGHLEGYAASYYTYMWSVVIAKDLLSVFEKEGMLNSDTARRLRANVLGPGGSQDAALLVKNFLGRDYNFMAYEKWMNRSVQPAASK